jgi:hypothetical protein
MLSDLEGLLELLKKHGVYVYKDDKVQVQFQPNAFVSTAPADEGEEDKSTGEANDDYDKTLFAASEG